MVVLGLFLTACQIVGVWVVVKKVGGVIYDYLSQSIAHCQHGIGKFEYVSKKQHEKERILIEELGNCWVDCNCDDCEKNRYNSVKWLRKYYNLPYALKAFDEYHKYD
jgi:hypothetical protein